MAAVVVEGRNFPPGVAICDDGAHNHAPDRGLNVTDANDAAPETEATDTETNAEAEAAERSNFVLRVRDAWRDTVGAYATEEGETANLFQRLVHFGAITGEESKRLVEDVKGRIEENRREMDRRVDESIRHTVARVSIPSQNELGRLNSKLTTIEERIKALESRRG